MEEGRGEREGKREEGKKKYRIIGEEEVIERNLRDFKD